MLAGVLVSDDLCAGRMQPLVAVGMVEMPVRVDEVRDGIGAEVGKRLGDLRARYADAGVDEHFAVRTGQDGDVSAGAFEHADIVSQLVRDDGRNRGAVLDQADEAARLRKRLARRKPSSRGRVSRTAEQHRQKRRRDNISRLENPMACSVSCRWIGDANRSPVVVWFVSFE